MVLVSSVYFKETVVFDQHDGYKPYGTSYYIIILARASVIAYYKKCKRGFICRRTILANCVRKRYIPFYSSVPMCSGIVPLNTFYGTTFFQCFRPGPLETIIMTLKGTKIGVFILTPETHLV